MRRALKLLGLSVIALVGARGAIAAPRVSAEHYGVTTGGEQVRAFTLANENGMSVTLLDYGGAIVEINAPDRNGRAANVVLALPSLRALEANAHVNTLIGRYANRIRNGFTLDGKHYPLPANAKGVTLHGGPSGYNRRIWAAAPFAAQGRAGVRLTLISPDGDQGFPGRLGISVTYSLNDTNELRIDYAATTDKPTHVALTNHLYVNLAGNGSGDVESHELQILADGFTPTDETQTPTGEIAPVAGTAFDFRSPKPIGMHIRSAEPQMLIGRGYDHNFVLNKPAGDPLALAARMRDAASGRVLEVHTTEPGLQIYTSNGFNGGLVGAAAVTIRQTDAIALETQHFPDSPNRPNFPSTILRPGEVLRSTTLFRFTTDANDDRR